MVFRYLLCEYFQDTDTLGIALTPRSTGLIANSDDVTPGLLVDYTANNQLVDFDVRMASSRTGLDIASQKKSSAAAFLQICICTMMQTKTGFASALYRSLQILAEVSRMMTGFSFAQMLMVAGKAYAFVSPANALQAILQQMANIRATRCLQCSHVIRSRYCNEACQCQGCARNEL